ncbi:MAG: hypothetical protein R2793_08495 [Flavobacteriaceae bacterium]
MKHLLFLFFFLSLVSCVEEGLTITRYDDTEAVALDAQLAAWVQSVFASFDGSYDDVYRLSPCFSINFSICIAVNG